VRFLEFFAAAILNPNTRRAYAHAVGEFLAWCAQDGVKSITEVQPLHVAVWIEVQTRTLSAPTVKQHLAVIRHLFDWLMIGQVVPHNPAASVRAKSYCPQRQDARAGRERSAATARQHRCQHTHWA
jgi:site-specific recombinase XerD